MPIDIKREMCLIEHNTLHYCSNIMDMLSADKHTTTNSIKTINKVKHILTCLKEVCSVRDIVVASFL